MSREQPLTGGQACGIPPVNGVQFLQNVAYMTLDGIHAEREPGCDFLIRGAGCNMDENLLFTGRQSGFDYRR